jgi:hypothetical protein
MPPSFKPEKSKSANRGKAEEKEVHEFLKRLSASRADFDFLRLPDARSAMGRVAAMPADFEAFTPSGHYLLEVKSSEHDYRLARDKVTQLPMMRKRILAGGRSIVLVYHSMIKKWRRVNVGVLDPTAPSWDLSTFAMYDSAEAALEGVFYA